MCVMHILVSSIRASLELAKGVQEQNATLELEKSQALETAAGLERQIAKQRSDSGAHSIAAPRRAFSRPIRARPGVHRHLARIADVLVRETADFRRAADERSAALQTQ